MNPVLELALKIGEVKGRMMAQFNISEEEWQEILQKAKPKISETEE